MQKLVFIVGVAGVGKSTIGKKIAEQLHFLYLDKDTITQPFVEVCNPKKNDRESKFYLNTIRPLEYQVLLDVAEENIKLGHSVIVSAPFGQEVGESGWLNREIVKRRCLDFIQVKTIWIKSDRKTERLRIIERNADRDQWKLEHWDNYCKQVETFDIKWEKHPQSYFEFDNRIQAKQLFSKQFDQLISWISEN